jgi:hypothetical protein
MSLFSKIAFAQPFAVTFNMALPMAIVVVMVTGNTG